MKRERKRRRYSVKVALGMVPSVYSKALRSWETAVKSNNLASYAAEQAETIRLAAAAKARRSEAYA